MCQVWGVLVLEKVRWKERSQVFRMRTSKNVVCGRLREKDEDGREQYQVTRSMHELRVGRCRLQVQSVDASEEQVDSTVTRPNGCAVLTVVCPARNSPRANSSCRIVDLIKIDAYRGKCIMAYGCMLHLIIACCPGRVKQCE